MEETIFDYISPEELAAYWNTRLADMDVAPYLGEILFPDDKQVGMDLSYIKGSKGRPVELNLSALDSKTIKRARIGFQEVKTRMPFFKNSMSIDEELRQRLLEVGASGNERAKEIILRKIFDDEMTLLEGAAINREKMRMQLISTGMIAMANNGQEYEYDYALPENHKVTAEITWDKEDADPVADITKWQDIIEADGQGRPTKAITSRKILRKLAKNANIKNTLYVFAQGKVIINDEIVRNYIYDQTGVTIEVYEKSYTDTDGVRTRYIPEDLFILIPDGPLGSTVFGTTPEEADLIGVPQAQVGIVDTGVAITTSKEIDPVTVTTKVSQMCMPSFDAADEIIIASVLSQE